MTLKTTLEVFNGGNPEAIYMVAREEVGIPQDHPFDSSTRHSGIIRLGHLPGGFRAAVDMDLRPDPANTPDPWADEESDPDSGWTIQLHLDTAYNGEWGLPEHYDVVARVIKRCNITRYRVNNEYTSEWFGCINAARKALNP